MRVHHRRWRAMRRPIVVLTVVAAASACAGHTSPTAAHATVGPATSVTAPPTTADPKSEVLAAYQRFWQVWLEANDPPNPNDPRLAEVATGGELQTIRLSIGNAAFNGTYTRLPPHSRYSHRPSVVTLSRRDALVMDCEIDDSRIIERSTGRVLNDDVVTEQLRSTAHLDGGVWRVSTVHQTRQWSGVRTC